MTADQTKKLVRRIEDGYRAHLTLDSLPVAEASSIGRSVLRPSATTGFPIGVPAAKSPIKGEALVYNHVVLTIQVHPADDAIQRVALEGDLGALGLAGDTAIEVGGTAKRASQDAAKKAAAVAATTTAVPSDAELLDAGATPAASKKWRIVGFHATPLSIDHTKAPCATTTDIFQIATAYPLAATAESISWTYSVVYQVSDIEWSTRWDVYMRTSSTESRVHLVNVVNSTLVVLLLSAVIGIILVRALKRDLARYNDPEALEEEREETGWKLLHGDVFRIPDFAPLLSVLVGSGVQLFSLGCLCMSCACLGFVSPRNRGSLATAFIFCFVLLGFVGGYVTGYLAKLFRCRSWKVIFAVGFFLPGSLFAIYIMLNFVHWGSHAASATPFGTILILMALWFCVSLPLVLLGGAAAYRTEVAEPPKKVHTIARTIPTQEWYMHPYAMVLLGGALPFGASFIEYNFILSSVWQGHIYYMFGFLFVAFALVMVIVAETSIFLTYMRLVRLDHRWWWPAFGAGAGYGVWMFVYGIYYFYRFLFIRNFWAALLYFGYTFMIAATCSVLTGAVALVASHWFVQTIFASLRTD
jgi:transmembrane 9 superfamily protein 2/4